MSKKRTQVLTIKPFLNQDPLEKRYQKRGRAAHTTLSSSLNEKDKAMDGFWEPGDVGYMNGL